MTIAGSYAWKATKVEMTRHEVAWTTDHWTGLLAPMVSLIS